MYTQGNLLYLADTLSRAFLSTNQVSGPQDGLEHISMVQYLPITEHRLQQIKEYTSSDQHLQQLRAVIMDVSLLKRKIYHIRWHHTSCIKMNCQYKTALYFMASESSYPLITPGYRGMITPSAGMFWPNMNADLNEYISACSICHSHETSQQQETLMPHDVPDRPWAKVGTDLYSISDTSYLIVIDYYSNFWEVDKLGNTDSVTVIKKMKTHFVWYGIPDQVVSDNGPQYTSHHFANFSRTWDFERITSSPGHSQSNGMTESAVKTAKIIIIKRAKE